MCNLSSALSYLLKSMVISLLLMMLWHWFCSNSCTVVLWQKKKKKNTVNILKISTHCFCFVFCFFLFLVCLFFVVVFCCCCFFFFLLLLLLFFFCFFFCFLLLFFLLFLFFLFFFVSMRQVGRDRKISNSHRKGYSCQYGLSQMIADQDFHQQCPLSRSNKKNKHKKWQKRDRENISVGFEPGTFKRKRIMPLLCLIP